MSDRKRRIVFLANLFIVISTLIITLRGVLRGAGKGQLGNEMIGLGYFKAFTIDSNVLNGIVSFMVVKLMIKERMNKHFRLTKDLVRWQFVAANATGLTLFVVATFLSPMLSVTGRSFFISFYKDMFFFHFLNPIIAGVLFVDSYKDYIFGRNENLLGLIPVIFYSIIYVLCVVILKIWPDFYGFTFGGKLWVVPIVVLVIYGVNFFIGKSLIYCHNRYVENRGIIYKK